MYWQQILQALLSLMFVIGLLFLCLWLFKYLEQKGLKSKFFQDFQNGHSINITEQKRLDSRNRLVLVKFNNQEHLILLSSSGNLVLGSNLVKGNDSHD